MLSRRHLWPEQSDRSRSWNRTHGLHCFPSQKDKIFKKLSAKTPYFGLFLWCSGSMFDSGTGAHGFETWIKCLFSNYFSRLLASTADMCRHLALTRDGIREHCAAECNSMCTRCLITLFFHLMLRTANVSTHNTATDHRINSNPSIHQFCCKEILEFGGLKG